MRAGSEEFHAANPPAENRSQHGQVSLTLPWAWINKMGTQICSGDDPEDENHLWLETRSQKLWQLQSVLVQKNSATRQQENLELYPNSLVFQQGTQMPRASCPSPVSLRKPQYRLAGKLKNQISKRQDTHQQGYFLTMSQPP